MQQLNITITSEIGDFASSLSEVTKGVTDGNRMGRGENDAESFEWSIIQTYGKDDGISF